MDLNYDELERYIDYICSGMKFINIDNVQLILRQPKLTDRIRARFIYDFEYKKALNDGLITNSDMKDLIDLRNLYTEEDRLLEKKLLGEINAQQKLLSKTTKVRARQDAIKNVLYSKELELQKLRNKERIHYTMTADTKAEESKLLFLCYKSCFRVEDEMLYWSSYDNFKNENNYTFRQLVVNEFVNFFNGLSTSVIRAVARSSIWRIKYLTSMKTSESLFGIPTSEYTNDMSNLVYWSYYYNNIYEMMVEDRPSDLIIDDDDALDAFMKDYYEERNREGARKKGTKSHGNLSAYDKEEVIVTRSDQLYEHIDYDKPKEAQSVKDDNLLNKRTRRR
jgi:hypothetical protein